MLEKNSTQIRPLVILGFCVVGILVGIAGWWFFSSSNLNWVARSMGSVDGKPFTNSVEAFKENFRRGFRTFQIDLRLTKDDEVCASYEEAPVHLDKRKFLTQKVLDKYEPICLETLTGLLKAYPEAFFIVEISPSRDPNDSFRRIYQKLFRAWGETPEFWIRVIPQIYQTNDLAYLTGFYRFHSVIYNLTRSKVTDDAVVLFLDKHPEVSAVAMDKKLFSSTVATEARKKRRQVYVLGVNETAEMKAFVKKGATGFFTDNHEPVSRAE